LKKIDRDFKDIKDILKELIEIEKQIDSIDKSQTLVMAAVDESLLFYKWFIWINVRIQEEVAD